MKWFLILVILFGAVDAAPSAEESLGAKIKKVLGPDPSPTPSRKHRKHSTKKQTPTPSIPNAEEQVKTQENVSYPNAGRIAVGNRDSVCESGGITRSWSRKERLA
jgi:hypothetical protein